MRQWSGVMQLNVNTELNADLFFILTEYAGFYFSYTTDIFHVCTFYALNYDIGYFLSI